MIGRGRVAWTEQGMPPWRLLAELHHEGERPLSREADPNVETTRLRFFVLVWGVSLPLGLTGAGVSWTVE